MKTTNAILMVVPAAQHGPNVPNADTACGSPKLRPNMKLGGQNQKRHVFGSTVSLYLLPMPSPTKIHLFQAIFIDSAAPFSIRECAQKAFALDIEARNRTIDGEQVRLENLDASNPGYVLMNIVRLRREGPGKAGVKKPVTSFGLAPDESYAHETAALYHDETGCFVIQYSHSGPRATGVAAYLSELFHPHSFSVVPVWKKDGMKALSERTVISKIDVKIAPKWLKLVDDNAASGVMDGIAVCKKNGAETIALTISAERGHSLSQRSTNSWFSWLTKTRASGEAEAIERFKVTASGDGLRSKEFDLLEPRIEMEVNIPAGPDRLIPLASRWEALKVAWREWSKTYP